MNKLAVTLLGILLIAIVYAAYPDDYDENAGYGDMQNEADKKQYLIQELNYPDTIKVADVVSVDESSGQSVVTFKQGADVQVTRQTNGVAVFNKGGKITGTNGVFVLGPSKTATRAVIKDGVITFRAARLQAGTMVHNKEVTGEWVTVEHNENTGVTTFSATTHPLTVTIKDGDGFRDIVFEPARSSTNVADFGRVDVQVTDKGIEYESFKPDYPTNIRGLEGVDGTLAVTGKGTIMSRDSLIIHPGGSAFQSKPHLKLFDTQKDLCFTATSDGCSGSENRVKSYFSDQIKDKDGIVKLDDNNKPVKGYVIELNSKDSSYSVDLRTDVNGNPEYAERRFKRPEDTGSVISVSYNGKPQGKITSNGWSTTNGINSNDNIDGSIKGLDGDEHAQFHGLLNYQCSACKITGAIIDGETMVEGPLCPNGCNYYEAQVIKQLLNQYHLSDLELTPDELNGKIVSLDEEGYRKDIDIGIALQEVAAKQGMTVKQMIDILDNEYYERHRTNALQRDINDYRQMMEFVFGDEIVSLQDDTGEIKEGYRHKALWNLNIPGKEWNPEPNLLRDSDSLQNAQFRQYYEICDNHGIGCNIQRAPGRNSWQIVYHIPDEDDPLNTEKGHRGWVILNPLDDGKYEPTINDPPYWHEMPKS